ncbi:MAG TPA: hypothetical protein VGK58_10440 [Lacipirellulaceae bacterium]
MLELSDVGFQFKAERIMGTYTLAQLVAENKKQVVFELNGKKKRMRARARKRLKSGHGM